MPHACTQRPFKSSIRVREIDIQFGWPFEIQSSHAREAKESSKLAESRDHDRRSNRENFKETILSTSEVLPSFPNPFPRLSVWPLALLLPLWLCADDLVVCTCFVTSSLLFSQMPRIFRFPT
ncbi:hypothetical protein KCU71_g117, partial [Aureobasidium melanogenum]